MIEDRDYTKQELADALYGATIKPESRIRNLHREVTRCRDLMRALKRLGYRTGSNGYTREQVICIKQYLCLD